MRSRGVSNWPDPEPGDSNTKFPSASQLGIASSELDRAERACEHLLPAGSDDEFPPDEVPLLLGGMVRFSACMRSHGVPNWPDPTTDSEGRPLFALSRHGFSRGEGRSPRLVATEAACQSLLPAALGGVPVG
jgi:hypothetical protein